VPELQYVEHLLQDLDYELQHVAARPLVSVFMGGGTPSLFAPESIARFLQGVRDRLPVDAGLEVTMEANPGTIEHGRFSGYRDAGVTRVSLGVQSFDGKHLETLGRIHSADEVEFAVRELKAAGLTNFNIDLMYGLPGQQVQQAIADVSRAIALAPTHLSHYQLTLEPGTAFYRRPPALPDDDVTWDMQVACQEAIAAAGYQQYEVSAYSLDRHECAHNLNYWRFGDYLGVGAGAHGKRTDLQRQWVVRTTRAKQPREYLAKANPAERAQTTTVAQSELPFEFMLNVLRLREGFSRELFEQRTGESIAVVAAAIARASAKDMLAESARGEWIPTDLGRRFLNDLQAEFLPEPSGY
jgi:oxygen-independent coproporphyrinogen-3 oxidase